MGKPGNCERGQVSALIGNVYGFREVFDSYYRLPVTVLLEKIICWPLNRYKKAVNNNFCDSKRVAAAA